MILAIDANTTSASVALYDQGTILSDLTINNGYTHSQNLLPLIDTALKYAGKMPSDVTKVITSNGPGSFTGIRIALSTAKAFCHASGAKLYTVSTLDALSYYGLYHNALVCPILNARRNQVYTRVIDCVKGVVAKDATMTIEMLLDIVESNLKPAQKALFVGDGVPIFTEVIKDRLGDQSILAERGHLNSSACGVIHAYLGNKAVAVNYDEVAVNYLRRPQAERELEDKNNND